MSKSKMDDNGKLKALQAKAMAEERIQRQDYSAAMTLIEEAQRYFPGLEHASEMLTVCRILCSAEIELPGYGVDWYWVIQLFSSVDTAAIETQYQKLISKLQPIKNVFPGTQLALKFVEDAFSVLSDPVKRAAFDLKRDWKDDGTNSQAYCSVVAPNEGNEVVNVGKTSAGGTFYLSSSPMTKRLAPEDCRSDDSKSLTESRTDEKKKKICAQEASWPVGQMGTEGRAGTQTVLCALEGNPSYSLQPLAKKSSKANFYDFGNNRKSQLFSEGQVWATYDQEGLPRCYARIDRIVWQEFKLEVTWLKPCPKSLDESRWCSAGLPVVCGSFGLKSGQETLSDLLMFSHFFSKGITRQPLEIYPKKGEVWAIYRGWNIEWSSDPGLRRSCGYEMVEILTDFMKDSGTKVVRLVKIDGFSNVYGRKLKTGSELSFQIPFNRLLMFSHNIPVYRFVGGEISGVSKGMLELDPLALPDDPVQDSSAASQSGEEVKCVDEASFTHLSDPKTCTLDTAGSNPGFQNFKAEWSAKDFSAEQVWAVYDGPDSMPRLYVKVSNVVSPTKVSVTFLEPHPMLDEEIHWMEEGLPFVCGIFRASRATAVLDMSKFSHVVDCQWSSRRSFYRIFPRKGEIWAVFKNWNSSWKNADLSGYQCRIVEIISEFSDEDGICICNLIEVSGCLTFFQRQLHEEFQLTRRLSRLELLSFSHRIPASTVVGSRDHRIPEGSWHLEPNALPVKSVG